MQNFFKFIWQLKKDATRNEILPLATQLTYRFIFALFPFLIFLIALVGYFNINPEHMMAEISATLPADIANIVNDIINEVTALRNPAILTGSLLLSLFTIANGFRAIMRGINRVYGQKDTRHPIKQWLICGALVLILALAVISSLLVIIFRNGIYGLLSNHFQPSWLTSGIFGIAGIATTTAILTIAVILIYKLASAKALPLKSLIPGAALTIATWAASTTAFNFYIQNFTNLSLIYGSIASIFITMLWLNIISITILLGAQLNANLSRRSIVKA